MAVKTPESPFEKGAIHIGFGWWSPTLFSKEHAVQK